MITISMIHVIMIYCSWDMGHDRCNCYFLYWAIFCPLTPLTAQKIKIFKKCKKHLDIYYHFIYVYQKLWSDDVQFLRYGAWQMDRQMNGQMDRQTDGWMDGKSDIQRWVPHPKVYVTSKIFKKQAFSLRNLHF